MWQLRPRLPTHQGPNGSLGIDLAIQQAHDLLTNRQAQPLALGQGQGGPGGAGPLHRGADPLQRFLFAQPRGQQGAEALVAAEAAGGGGQQITQARQAVEGGRLAAEGFEHHADLGQAATEQGGAGIGAKAQSIADAGRHRHHVFEGAGGFGADRVSVGVQAQVGSAQLGLKPAGKAGVRGGDHAGSRQAPIEFVGEVGAA